jgi:hypothetical protein
MERLGKLRLYLKCTFSVRVTAKSLQLIILCTEALDLRACGLTGTIPSLVNMTSMGTLGSRCLLCCAQSTHVLFAARIGLAENSLRGPLSTDIGSLSTLSTNYCVILVIPRYGLVLISVCSCSRIECALQSVDGIDTDRTWETVEFGWVCKSSLQTVYGFVLTHCFNSCLWYSKKLFIWHSTVRAWQHD